MLMFVPIYFRVGSDSTILDAPEDINSVASIETLPASIGTVHGYDSTNQCKHIKDQSDKLLEQN